MFEKWKAKQTARKDAINKAREGFTSWLEISKSAGWKIYEEKIDKRIEVIDGKFHNETTLTGDDLKKLQLAYQVWKEAKRLPKEIEENAKGGLK